MPAIDVPGGWDTLLAGPARGELERRALPDFLRAQRWFGGKARELTGVRVADWGPLPAEGVTAFLVLLAVGYADGGDQLYFVPLAVAADAADGDAVARLSGPAGGAVLRDAAADPAVSAALLDAVCDGREFATQLGRVRAVPTAAFDRLRGDPGEPLSAGRGPAASSNTLVFFGGRLVLKVFRRLEGGVNPDVEVGRFLSETGRFPRTPAVAGFLEYAGTADPGPYTVGILQAVVPNQGDGWAHALAELGRYYAGGPADGYLGDAALLGRRTAELHLALAGDAADPAFAPEPLAAADLAALGDEIGSQGRRAMATLGGVLDRLPADVAPEARRLLDVGPAALDRLAADRAAVPAAVKTRVHGDYHLGQVLRADNDYVVLDFEGEPTRPVAERRGKFSPVRDVAGMVRSYHYAAYAGLFAAAGGRAGEFARLEPLAGRWYRDVSAAFLGAYREAAGAAPFVPRGPGEFGGLLDRYLLAKALYELNYELNNRPDWVRIPLGGVLSLLGPAAGGHPSPP